MSDLTRKNEKIFLTALLVPCFNFSHISNVIWFIGRTDVEAETPIFWPPDAKR